MVFGQLNLHFFSATYLSGDYMLYCDLLNYFMKIVYLLTENFIVSKLLFKFSTDILLTFLNTHSFASKHNNYSVNIFVNDYALCASNFQT